MKNLPWLACKFDLYQRERKSSQVNASARKPWPNGVASRPKFSTCVYLRVRLARALGCILIYGNWAIGGSEHRFARRTYVLSANYSICELPYQHIYAKQQI